MKFLDKAEYLIAKLEVSPKEWNYLTSNKYNLNAPMYPIIDCKFHGLTVENFERDSPLDHVNVGVNSQFGSLIGVWTAFSPLSCNPWLFGFTGASGYFFKKSFVMSETRDKLLEAENPFRIVESFY